MTTDPQLGVLSQGDSDHLIGALGDAGARILRGTFVDAGGVFRAKQVPLSRAAVFHSPGLGASPVWVIFCIDDGIAFTPSFGAVGDMRLRADLEAAVELGDGVAWAPLELADQQGAPMAFCPRGVLRRQQAAAEADGLDVLAATEIELVLFDRAGDAVAGNGGPAYGMRPLMEHGAFLDDVHADFDHAGLRIEQLHAEYGSGQIELSVAPDAPLQAADANVLARILLCRAARRHGLAASFSPKVFVDGIGNGAHVHLSFARGEESLLSGGDGPHGLTDEGGAIIGGLVRRLPEVVGALAPSLLSDVRLQPGHWSGAFACWGLENREAAIRLIAGTPAIRARRRAGDDPRRLMDIHLLDAAPTVAERAAVEHVLGPPAGGWDGGARDSDGQGHSLRGGGHEARSRRHLLLPVLLAVQEHIGWVSPGALNHIAERLTVPPADVYGVATFYALLSVEPRPPRVIHVCEDLACRCNGSQELIAQLEEHLGAEGELNADGSATWLRSPCLGQCDRAPAAMVTLAGEHPRSTCSRRSTRARRAGGDRRPSRSRAPIRSRRCRSAGTRRCALLAASATSTRRASTTTARRAATRRCAAPSSWAARASSASSRTRA